MSSFAPVRVACIAFAATALLGEQPAQAQTAPTVSMDVGPSLLVMEHSDILTTVDDVAFRVDTPISTDDERHIGLGGRVALEGLDLLGQQFALLGSASHVSIDYAEQCVSTAPNYCAVNNLFDLRGDDQTLDSGRGGQALSETDRSISQLDLRAEWRSPDLAGDGDQALSARFALGVSAQTLDQTADIDGRITLADGTTRATFDYDEEITTRYFGGYVGLDLAHRAPGGWLFEFGGRGGVSAAHTDYDGVYTAASDLVGIYNYVQRRRLEDSGAAFLGEVETSIGRDFGGWTFALYGRGSYISRVPVVRYNNDDVDDVRGDQQGAELDFTSALGAEVGARIVLPLN